jgi:type IV pilus assembly protein PilO
MNSQLQKQILIGGISGLLILVVIYFLLGGKRDDLAALRAGNVALKAEVDRGYALKDIYEKLKVEVAEQEKVIEELIRIMPTEADRGEMPYRVKKLADAAGIEQVSFSLLPPVPKEYYTEYPVQFSFRAGYHTLGQFTSLVSGFGKIINITDLAMTRVPGNTLYPINAACKISAFVYNPAKPAPAPAAGAPPTAAAAPAKQTNQGD